MFISENESNAFVSLFVGIFTIILRIVMLVTIWNWYLSDITTLTYSQAFCINIFWTMAMISFAKLKDIKSETSASTLSIIQFIAYLLIFVIAWIGTFFI